VCSAIVRLCSRCAIRVIELTTSADNGEVSMSRTKLPSILMKSTSSARR